MAAMGSVQLGSALSLPLISTAGPAGTSWLRLSVGALVFLALARPPLRAIRPRDVPALTGLGVATGLQTITFLAAIARIPLGTAVAVEFLGPVSVAAARTRSTRALTWPALALAGVALAGVALLTQPWHGGSRATSSCHRPGETVPTGCTGRPGVAATSTAPGQPANAGTPTPRQNHDHNELQPP